jgi:hypothetical protein
VTIGKCTQWLFAEWFVVCQSSLLRSLRDQNLQKNPAFERSISQFPGKKINSIFVGGGGWNIAILVM